MAGKDSMGLVPTRSEAVRLNAMVREELRGRGLLPAADVRYTNGDGPVRHEVALAVGDRVAFTTNDYRAGVYNGMRGTVIGFSPGKDVSVKLDESYQRVGRDGTVRTDPAIVRDAAVSHTVHGPEPAQYVDVPAHQVAQRTSMSYMYVTHDYARTLPRAQGATIDHVVIAAHAESNAFSRQWGTVAFTRHREDVQVHLSAAGMRPDHVLSYEPAHWPREARQEASIERRQHAAPEPHRSFTPELPFDEKTRADALDEAADRLAQDRPGPSTLDYHEVQVDRVQAIGSAESAPEAGVSEIPVSEHDTREAVTAKGNPAHAELEHQFEPELIAREREDLTCA
jgi:hypothetical protein